MMATGAEWDEVKAGLRCRKKAGIVAEAAAADGRGGVCAAVKPSCGHGKLPDVVIYMRNKNWLLLIESVTSHGPVEPKRQLELARLFKACTAGLTAFPNRKTFLKHLDAITWESGVWIAAAPTHMVHFNGVRFLGPYE